MRSRVELEVTDVDTEEHPVRYSTVVVASTDPVPYVVNAENKEEALDRIPSVQEMGKIHLASAVRDANRPWVVGTVGSDSLRFESSLRDNGAPHTIPSYQSYCVLPLPLVGLVPKIRIGYRIQKSRALVVGHSSPAEAFHWEVGTLEELSGLRSRGDKRDSAEVQSTCYQSG